MSYSRPEFLGDRIAIRDRFASLHNRSRAAIERSRVLVAISRELAEKGPPRSVLPAIARGRFYAGCVEQQRDQLAGPGAIADALLAFYHPPLPC